MTTNIAYDQTVAQRMNHRERMVSSAVALFRERGVAGTALSDVVEHSGAPRGSIYHYFPDGKAQLAREATAHAGRLLDELITRWLARHGPAATIERIVEMFRRQLRDTDFASGCPVAAGALESGDAPAARATAGEAFASWETTLSTALQAHGHAPHRADTLASLIVCAIEGAIIVAKAQRDMRPLDRVAEELTTLLRAEE
jgi:TetR/AcrR family transcriptional regulator, lmrAB and yxaGH operons repressor